MTRLHLAGEEVIAEIVIKLYYQYKAHPQRHGLVERRLISFSNRYFHGLMLLIPFY